MKEDENPSCDEENNHFFHGEVHHISPSKIADQFWCEMQLHLRLELGMEPTEEMILGTKIHKQLEEELGPVVELEIETIDDNIIAFILQTYTKLETLTRMGITRELPIIGKITDFFCIGIIDQIQFESTDNSQVNLVITDYKTRKSKNQPSYEQKRRNRIQIQIYWHLLNGLIEGEFNKETFEEYYKIPAELAPSMELKEQLPMGP